MPDILDSPPVAPEEAVRLVDALTQAAYQKGSSPFAGIPPTQLEKARTALLNYIGKQAKENGELRRDFASELSDYNLESRVAALTAEKEAMQKVVIATERYLCTDSPSVRDKCKVWDALDALQKQRRQSAFEALTPKPPTDSTEAPKP